MAKLLQTMPTNSYKRSFHRQNSCQMRAQRLAGIRQTHLHRMGVLEEPLIYASFPRQRESSAPWINPKFVIASVAKQSINPHQPRNDGMMMRFLKNSLLGSRRAACRRLLGLEQIDLNLIKPMLISAIWKDLLV